MKRILITLTAALITATSFSQTSVQVNFNTLEKKIDRSNQDVDHPKKNIKYQTWMSRAELMMEAYDAMTLGAYAGMSINEFLLIVGGPKQQIQEEIDGMPITRMEMERVDFIFVEELLESWTFTKPIYEKPLFEAYRSFVKAIELDEKGRAKDKIAENLVKLKYSLITEGSNYYTKKEYVNSYDYFVKSIDVGMHPFVNQIDTIMFYYTGLSAQLDSMFENAIEYYKKGIEYDFSSDGNIYYYIYEAYSSLGKAEDGLQYLQEGFLKVPNNKSVLFSLINYYIEKDDDPKAVLTYMDKAKETDPDNYTLYFAEGILHDRLENLDLAEKAYKKSIELNPDNFDAVFNLGALYFNAGVKHAEEATKIPAREDRDGTKYDAKMKEADYEFKKSIPIMERAFEINPNNLPTIETLKNLYFRFRTEGDEMQEKYQKINELWIELQ